MKKSLKWIIPIAAIWLIVSLIVYKKQQPQEPIPSIKKEVIEIRKEKSEISYKNSIQCKIVQKTEYYTRVVTSEMLKDSDLLQIVKLMAIPTNIVYFHLPDYVGSSQEYGWVMGTSTFVMPEFDGHKMKKQSTPDPLKKKKVSKDDPDFARKAFVVSQDFVKRQLTSPKSADFPLLDYKYSNVIDNTIVIESYVDAKNSYNAEVRQNYWIKLKFKGGEWEDINNWSLIDLKFTGQ